MSRASGLWRRHARTSATTAAPTSPAAMIQTITIMPTRAVKPFP